MVVTIYILLIMLVVLGFCLGWFGCLYFQSFSLSSKEQKAFEVELFGENDDIKINKSPFEVLNSISEEKLEKLKHYYERQEEFFSADFRDFITKANIYFQMYLWGWGYVGALVIFLLSGYKDTCFPLVKNIHVEVCFLLLVLINLVFFIQITKAVLLMPAYQRESKNSVILNISLPNKDFLRRCVQNKAFVYNCNSKILYKVKRSVLWTPVKFIVVMALFTLLAMIVVYGR